MYNKIQKNLLTALLSNNNKKINDYFYCYDNEHILLAHKGIALYRIPCNEFYIVLSNKVKEAQGISKLISTKYDNVVDFVNIQLLPNGHKKTAVFENNIKVDYDYVSDFIKEQDCYYFRMQTNRQPLQVYDLEHNLVAVIMPIA